LQAEDNEAARIVEQLSKAMTLKFGLGTGRKLCVKVDDESPECGKIPFNLNSDSVIAVLNSPQNRDLLTIQMYKISLIIARSCLARGGLILHGALAEYKGMGVILAGPGKVGKSTASKRLPEPWKSFCDDACLVVRDDWGQFWAHPLPTWSLFYQNGLGGRWDVQQAVPLKAIFFLRQSPQDRIEELNESQEVAMLMESTNQISRTITLKLPDTEVQAIHVEQMNASEVLAKAVRAYMLHISLTGMFWKELERVLLAETSHTFIRAIRAENDAPITVVFTGVSMKPTFQDGYLLTVAPYVNDQIKKGDVIYFQRKGQVAVVHRVVRVSNEGVQTKGDNNSSNDSFLLQKDEIIGKVIAARNGRKSWRIHGGMGGYAIMRLNQLVSSTSRRGARMMAGPYQRMADQNIFLGILPPNFRPKVVSFKVSMYRNQFKLKLIAGSHEIGRYDDKSRKWQIKYPFRLFVDQSKIERITH
jgi:signal peptidase I